MYHPRFLRLLRCPPKLSSFPPMIFLLMVTLVVGSLLSSSGSESVDVCPFDRTWYGKRLTLIATRHHSSRKQRSSQVIRWYRTFVAGEEIWGDGGAPSDDDTWVTDSGEVASFDSCPSGWSGESSAPSDGGVSYTDYSGFHLEQDYLSSTLCSSVEFCVL